MHGLQESLGETVKVLFPLRGTAKELVYLGTAPPHSHAHI